MTPDYCLEHPRQPMPCVICTPTAISGHMWCFSHHLGYAAWVGCPKCKEETIESIVETLRKMRRKPKVMTMPYIETPEGTPGSEAELSQFEKLAKKLGELVRDKNAAYGDSVATAGQILAILYPRGIRQDQYRDVLLMTRMLDKLSRIAQRGPDGKDKGGESPWKDIAGYGLCGWQLDGDE